jgi:nucleotide-binding universal stress UspA family protein
MFKHILVPTDGSQLSQQAVARAVMFAREAGARITVFHAQPDDPAVYAGIGAISGAHVAQEMHRRLSSASEEILAAAAQVAIAAGVECRRVVLAGGEPYERIIEAAVSGGCDLIFMASHGRRGAAALLLGSETSKVLAHCRIPVLVYR